MKLILTFIIGLILINGMSVAQFNLNALVLEEGGKRVVSTPFVSGLSIGQQIASASLISSPFRIVFGFWNPVTGPLVGIEEKDIQKASSNLLAFSLNQCSPNPFNKQTVIRYSIAKETEVNLKVFNTVGRVVTTLVNGNQKPGAYNVTWNLKGISQSRLPNGVYFYRLEAGEFTATKKMVKTE